MTKNTQQIGVVCPVPMGLWQNTIPYEKVNIIRYSGSSYIAKKSSINIEPTVSQNWQDVWELMVSNGVAALMCDYMPKETNSPDYYIQNTFSFSNDSFNRIPEVGENFITPYQQINTDSYLVSWKVITIGESAMCNVVDYIKTTENAVTLDGEQTITGMKTFLSGLYIRPSSDPTKQGVEFGSDDASSFVKLTSPDQTISVMITSEKSVIIKDNVNDTILAELSFPEQTKEALATAGDVTNAKSEAIQTAVKQVNDSMEVKFSITPDGLLHVEENNNNEEENKK